jgi:hypothetical protein
MSLSSRYITLAIRTDEEPSQLLSKITIASVGVGPRIRKALLGPGESKKESEAEHLNGSRDADFLSIL